MIMITLFSEILGCTVDIERHENGYRFVSTSRNSIDILIPIHDTHKTSSAIELLFDNDNFYTAIDWCNL